MKAMGGTLAATVTDDVIFARYWAKLGRDLKGSFLSWSHHGPRIGAWIYIRRQKLFAKDGPGESCLSELAHLTVGDLC